MLYSIKIFHEIPLYEINENGVVLVKAGWGPGSSPFAWGPSSSTVSPEAHPEKPQNAGDLGLKTKNLVSPLIFSLRKQVQRSDMTCSELVLASGRTRTRTQVSSHPIQNSPPITHAIFFGGTYLLQVTSPRSLFFLVFIFPKIKTFVHKSHTSEQKALLNFNVLIAST